MSGMTMQRIPGHCRLPLTEDRRQERANAPRQGVRKSEQGAALIVVLVLSGIMLAIMTSLVYMITVGTQMSGAQKQYKTALQAGLAGTDIIYQVIGFRGDTTNTNTFLGSLNSQGLNASVTVASACTGSAAGTVPTPTGFQTKIISSTDTWVSCNSTVAIEPTDPSTYDLKFQLGSYNVYAKIVDTIAGNTGDDYGLTNKGVVSSGSGELPVVSYPSQYTIEVEAENTALSSPERAKLSVLYQY